MARIVILTGGPLWTNPRAVKEADALAEDGHDVTVGGVWFDALAAERDGELRRDRQWSFRPLLDFRPSGVTGRITNVGVRAEARIARELFKRTGAILRSLHGYGASQMLTAALRMRPDLTIVHSEAGLWAGENLLRRGFRVGVDFEDWFSEDLRARDRSLKAIPRIKTLECLHARRCVYKLTTSHSLAAALGREYDTEAPRVVYNVFPPSETVGDEPRLHDRVADTRVSLHWFSQTIGPGRGLELLFEALRLLRPNCEIHLRGSASEHAMRWLLSLVPADWRDVVKVHHTVSNAELPKRISEHDIGLALESASIRSRDLTVTNKIFQYMEAGLAIIATGTTGQKEIFAEAPGIGAIIPDGDSAALARAITDLVSNTEQLIAAKRNARESFHAHFSWLKQRSVIIESASRALA